ncbi:MAG TPA: HEAT repeat domain-containing protein [Anaerolineales bacterium]|nr:HEAT repeat domain-containing protein [Anaerolineales bacterium]
MSSPAEIPFDEVLAALLNGDTPLKARFLYRLSDLDPEELALLKAGWPRLPGWRRRALLEDLDELGSADDLLSFEGIGRHAVTDEDALVRLLGVHLLWEFDAHDLIPLFLELLRSDAEADVRAAAATALSQFVYLGEIDRLPPEKLGQIEDTLLASITRDSSHQVRLRALESIGYSSRDEVPPLIERTFSAGDQEGMASALTAMGRSMDERWEQDVVEMLEHQAAMVRAEAARAAGEMELSEAVARLVNMTRDSDEDVRYAAIWSLSQIGGDRARQALENLLRRAEVDEEAGYIESALDNLAFNDGLEAFSLFNIAEGDEDLEDDDFEDEDDYLDFDDEEDLDEGGFLDTDDYDDIEDEDRRY